MPVDLAPLVRPDRCALVLQEVQEGVVGEHSALPALAAEAARIGVVPNCARLAAGARSAGVPVFHCTAETRDDLVGANRNACLFLGVRRAPVRLSPGSAAVRPPPVVGVGEHDVVLARHHGLGPMTGTQLDPMLRNLGVATIVGVGVSLNIGMLDLAFTAVNLGYQIVVPRDAVAGLPAAYAAAVLEHTLPLVATLTDTDAVLDAWARAPGSSTSVSRASRMSS